MREISVIENGFVRVVRYVGTVGTAVSAKDVKDGLVNGMLIVEQPPLKGKGKSIVVQELT